jgi:hypothetical protein
MGFKLRSKLREPGLSSQEPSDWKFPWSLTRTTHAVFFALCDRPVSVGGFGPNKAHDLLSLLIASMSDQPKSAPSTRDLLRNSLLYRQFQAQREEVLKHKWYESEKAGHDIGFDRALTDWAIKHRAEWLKRWKKELID